jgi:hypothetical protein
MSQVVLPREATLPRVEHPVNLKGWVRGGEMLVRIDHPCADWIRADLHDPRFALYANTRPDRNTWELWRLEHDGRYRQSNAWDGKANAIGPEFARTVIDWVYAHDTRRGYDPVADIDQHERTRERRLDRDFSDYTQDFADTYLWPALRKAGLHRHVPTTVHGGFR